MYGLIETSTLTDIADAIRGKLGVQTQYKPGEMPEAIESISGGGITPTGTKSITANGTYDVASYASAEVNVPSVAPTGTKQISITANGTTTEDVTNYANAQISVNVVNQDYEDALVALGVTEDLTDGIEALTTYANGVTGESDTTLSDAVASLADGYGGGGGISDGCEITALDANGFPTAVDHYGTSVHYQQYWNRTSADGFWRNLESIAFKDIVTSIDGYAFTNCSKLAVPDLSHVTSIRTCAFQGCSAFTAVSVPELTVFNSFVFNSCANLKTVYLPKCTSCSSQRGFGGCPALETVQLGSVGYTVTTVHDQLFYQLTQSTLTITVYTDGSHVDSILAKIKSNTGAVNATVIFKASEATTYNGTSYAAGDTILTSTPS